MGRAYSPNYSNCYTAKITCRHCETTMMDMRLHHTRWKDTSSIKYCSKDCLKAAKAGKKRNQS